MTVTDDTSLIASLHSKQDDADDFETANTGVTAVEDIVEDMPNNVDVNWFYDANDRSVKEETVPAGLDILKSEFYAALAFYDGVDVHIQVQESFHSSPIIGAAHSYTAGARKGMYLVGQNADFTIAEKRTWLAANLLGESTMTVTEPAAWAFQFLGLIFVDDDQEIPKGPIHFADPDGAARFTFTDLISESENTFNATDFPNQAFQGYQFPD